METLILTLDTIAVMVMIYFSYKGGKLPDEPELGPFRIRPYEPAQKPNQKSTQKSIQKRSGRR